jgi:hypothetical protein
MSPAERPTFTINNPTIQDIQRVIALINTVNIILGCAGFGLNGRRLI